ncbi:MAG: ATP-binding protein [Candidatus Peribacteria bacterium]|jgi:AAA+ ATPase superfamily predicted ATPase|nr:ATP-binding protein [Candidatus Peribacteria bacterium]
MKFYDRKAEIKVLQERLTSPYFDLIYLLGRRRVGKTELIQHLHTNILHTDFLYVFVGRTDLSVFLHNQEEYFYEKLGMNYQFKNIEKFLDTFFKQDKIDTLVLDEFQNFDYIDKSIFSTFQKKIDEYHNKSNKKIIVLGSLQSMMIKIFENANEPLYKRATFHLFLEAFDLETQIEILKDLFGKQYTHKILLDLYSIFGGIPYYFNAVWEKKYQSYDIGQIFRDLFFSEFGLLKDEGREILIEEFGQKYKRFFAILEAIATGKTKRNEIIEAVGLGTGEIDLYLRELAQIYSLIEVVSPVLEPKTNLTRYKIKDNFLNFRFRYVYANMRKFELRVYDTLVDVALKDFESFKGFQFEKLVEMYLIEKNRKG